MRRGTQAMVSTPKTARYRPVGKRSTPAFGIAHDDAPVVSRVPPANSSTIAMEDDAMEEAMEDDEEAMEDDEAMEDEDTDFAPADEVAAESEETATPSTTTTANGLAARTDELRNLRDLTAVNNLDVLDDLIDLGTIAPKYSAADLATVREVSPECIEPRDGVSMPTPYALANLTLFGGVDRLILVEFADDGSTRVLDAEDCAPLR